MANPDGCAPPPFVSARLCTLLFVCMILRSDKMLLISGRRSVQVICHCLLFDVLVFIKLLNLIRNNLFADNNQHTCSYVGSSMKINEKPIKSEEEKRGFLII